MSMRAFDYVRAETAAEATAYHAEAADARYLAGGQTLIPVLKQRLAAPTRLIDISRLPDLQGIAISDSQVTIGAMTRHGDVAAHARLAETLPALAELAGGIGDPHVRNRGTIGGSLANNDPSADYPAAVLGLGATVVTDRRTIAADDYFQGLFTTALEDGELITAVVFPVRRRAGYSKFPQPASRYAMVGVMVADIDSGVRVAVTGAGPGVFRATAMEQALSREFRPEVLDGIEIDAESLTADMHGTAAYRANLVRVMAQRAVAKAIG